MKMLNALLSMCFSLFSLSVYAGWEIANPKGAAPQNPFFQAGESKGSMPSAYSSRAFPNQFASLGTPAPVYAISISGSLKENLERIMARYHWHVVWRAPYDFNFDGRVAGSSLPNVVEKLLKPFPLRAVMYMSNRTMMVVAKNQ